MSQPATHETDVLVVGSGNGALTAALCARELGVRDVLVIEKSPALWRYERDFGWCTAQQGRVRAP
jgi:thioredoxin reductase